MDRKKNLPIIEEIVELKIKKPQTQEIKMRIQKLQQKLNK